MKLAKTSSHKKRCSLLNAASCDELLSLVEICFNILKAGFKLTEPQKDKLRPHAQAIRKLGAVKNESLARKIIQTHKFPFNQLLSPIIREVTRQEKNEQ